MENSLKEKLIENGYNGKFDLSSLLEACGDNICLRLQSYWSENDLMWQADDWGNFIITERDIIAGVGSSPEEAVSNLWLELNK